MSEHDPYLIQPYTRLSESKLWAIQENYFLHRGIDVFKKEVPFYISSNTFIAQHYAYLLFNFITEWRAQHPEYLHLPFTILELGAGSGKFSFYFLKAFQKLIDQHASTFTWRYVISDMVPGNVDFCMQNQDFKSFIERGILDFAYIDVNTDDDINLKFQNKTLTATHQETPLILIGNYVFDCMQQDLFVKNNGQLKEVQIEVKSRYPEFNQDKPEYLNELRFKHQYYDISIENYYKNPIYNQLLVAYQKDVSEGTMIPIPVTALNFLSYLEKKFKTVFFICGDKGVALKERLMVSSPQAQYSYDGCYSFFVNFHAMGQYCIENRGSYIPTEYNNSFKVNLFSIGFTLDTFKTTTSVYRNFIETGGADEFCALMGECERSSFRFDARTITSFLKMSYWDPDVYCSIHDRLMETLSAFNLSFFPDLLKDIEQVSNNIYSLRRDPDPCNLLGIFYQTCGMNDKAIAMYNKALSLHGDRPAPHHNLGMIYERIGHVDKAISHYQKALKINKKDGYAKKRLYVLKGNFFAMLWPIFIKLSTVLLGLAAVFWIFNR